MVTLTSDFGIFGDVIFGGATADRVLLFSEMLLEEAGSKSSTTSFAFQINDSLANQITKEAFIDVKLIFFMRVFVCLVLRPRQEALCAQR